MTLSEWATPSTGSAPLHIVPANSATFYFTESGKDRVAELNTATNVITEWLLPSGSMPHGILYYSNTIYFCAFSGNYVGALNPATSVLTVWKVPTTNAGTIHVDVSSASLMLFTEANGNNIGTLNTATGQFSEWPIPTPSARPRGIAAGQGSQVFVVELGAQKIAMLDTSANTITEWTLPSVKGVEHLRYSGGLVYFSDLVSSILGTLDPVADVVTEWKAPTSQADIPEVFISSGSVNFTERKGNNIGLLNPQLQTGTSKTVTPVVTPVSPTLTTVNSQIYNLKPVPTTVQPAVSSVNGVVTEGFTEWALPTPGSGPQGISGTGSTIVFTEFYGSRVATLTPAP